MYHFTKPTGEIHDVLRRAVEELCEQHNPSQAIQIINSALAGTEYAVGPRVVLPSSPTAKSASPIGNRPHSVVAAAMAQGSALSNRLGPPVVGVVTGNVIASKLAGAPNPVSSSITYKADGVTPVSPASSAVKEKGSPRSALDLFNSVQLERLLLLRADAYAMMHQPEKSLRDALSAVEVSSGQSPLAYFTVGRQHRQMWAIEEALLAFQTADTLIASVIHAYVSAYGNTEERRKSSWSMTQCLELAVWNQKIIPQTGSNTDNGEQQEQLLNENAADDEEFWASLGYCTQEVAALGLSRYDFERQQAELQRTREEYRQRRANCSPIPAELQNTLPTPSSSTSSGSPVSPMNDTVNLTEVEMLTLFGMGLEELGMWRRLKAECQALLEVNEKHTIPSSSYSAALTTLWPTVSGVRCGVIVSVENSTSRPLEFVGALLQGGSLISGQKFPSVIPKGHVGVAVLQTMSSWTGFHGSLCFELANHLSCFCYFDVPMLSAKKVGIRLVEHPSHDLRRAFGELNEGALPAVTGPSSNYSSRAPPATTLGVRVTRIPPNSVWLHSHTANSATRRIKVWSTVYGSDLKVMQYIIAEVPPVPLSLLELLPALEYAGPYALKKVSQVNRACRKMVNHLPPTLFNYGVRRTAYPDYMLEMDRRCSPWVIRDKEQVVWRIFAEGRIGDNWEMSLMDASPSVASGPNNPILRISSDVNSSSGVILFGGRDSQRRTPLAYVKEQWSLFSQRVFHCETPLGNQFAHVTTNQRGHIVFTFSGYGTTGREQSMIVAKKSETQPGSLSRPSSEVSRTVGDALITSKPYYQSPPKSGRGPQGASNASVSSGGFPSLLSGSSAGLGSSTGILGSALPQDSVLTGRTEVKFSLWQPREECGGSLVDRQPENTNNGEDFIGDVLVLPYPWGRGQQIGEIKINPNIDSLCVLLLCFTILRS